MRAICYRNQCVILILWIFIVLGLFKLISDRPTAALLAGTGFVFFPLWFLYSEIINQKNKIHILALSLFLLCSALPIFFLRVTNWGADFTLLGLGHGQFQISASQLHKYSNYLYMLMLGSTIYHLIKEKMRHKSSW
mgnify:CR=1 FL=1